MNIYVGNLPFDATEADLRGLFADYGTITSAAVVTDRDTGRSRGFGFVELADEALAGKAIGNLDGHDWNGRRLTVNQARPRNARS
ncbi:MAG: RNA-binding protein [Actinobacteria bacterium]|nr:MAG: RNA-binding protein [Actinomycetota bacterium]